MTPCTRRDFLTYSTAAALAPWPSFAQEADDGLVVHEWGVVTLPNGGSLGNLRSAGAKPSAGGGPEIPAGLPAFAMTWKNAVDRVVDEWERQPIDKPIVYFHSKRRTEVSFRVAVPTGRPRAWWPPAGDFGPKPNLPGGKARQLRRAGEAEPDPRKQVVKPENGYLHWPKLVVDPEPAALREAEGWWGESRKTQAATVSAGGESERFVFYDAFARVPQDLRILWKEDGRVEISNPAGRAHRHLAAIRVRAGRCAFAVHRELATGARVELELQEGRPDRLAETLVEAGLYADEVAALVRSWEREWFGIDGERVLVVLPRETYDALLPAEIVPAPRQFVRVLVAQIECLGPDRRKELAGMISRLGSESLEERSRAVEEIRRIGPLAEIQLREALKETEDPDVAAQIRSLLGP